MYDVFAAINPKNGEIKCSKAWLKKKLAFFNLP